MKFVIQTIPTWISMDDTQVIAESRKYIYNNYPRGYTMTVLFNFKL